MGKTDWTAVDLQRHATAAATLVDYLRTVDEDDEDLIEDVVEGETDLKETIEQALEQIAEAEMMVVALKGREAKLAQRRKRFEDRAKYVRGLIEMAMAIANGDGDLSERPFTLTTPSATVTLKNGKATVIIEDESLIPAKFFKSEPKLDKAALNKAATDPDNLPPGVRLSEAGFQIAIRRG